MAEKEDGPFGSIARTIGGISLTVVVVVAVFAREHLCVAAWIVAALTAMGIFPGLVASKRRWACRTVRV